MSSLWFDGFIESIILLQFLRQPIDFIVNIKFNLYLFIILSRLNILRKQLILLLMLNNKLKNVLNDIDNSFIYITIYKWELMDVNFFLELF